MADFNNMKGEKMTRESIKKKLARYRTQMDEVQKKIKELETLEKEADDAENMKIIKKSNISPDQLMFFNGLKEDEIKMILKKRKEEEELATAEKEKKKTSDNAIG